MSPEIKLCLELVMIVAAIAAVIYANTGDSQAKYLCAKPIDKAAGRIMDDVDICKTIQELSVAETKYEAFCRFYCLHEDYPAWSICIQRHISSTRMIILFHLNKNKS